MTTDRELLEMAAKAARYQYAKHGGYIVVDGIPGNWNPITDDGDALRLAVRLGLKVLIDLDEGATRIHNVYDGLVCMHMHFDGDPEAATRRAIVRAAADVGKAMP